jgi:serine/threonine protein phosphatase PrpC
MGISFEHAFQTHVGRVRTNNEDAYGERQIASGHVFVLCDGMGGHNGGEYASQKGVECILEYCSRSTGENVVQMLHEAIKYANSQIHGYATVNPEFSGMGTTCVVVFVTHGNELYHAHVGDSRLYVLNAEGLKTITRDHSYVQFLVDSGEIQPHEMETHPARNKILRALGTEESVKPEIGKLPYLIQGGESFLLCSDGLNGMISGAEIEYILNERARGVDIEKRLEGLIHAALQAGGKDNVTVGLLDFAGEFVAGEASKSGTRPVMFKDKRMRVAAISLAALILLAGIFSAWYFFKGDDLSSQPAQDETIEGGESENTDGSSEGEDGRGSNGAEPTSGDKSGSTDDKDPTKGGAEETEEGNRDNGAPGAWTAPTSTTVPTVPTASGKPTQSAQGSQDKGSSKQTDDNKGANSGSGRNDEPGENTDENGPQK